MSRKLATDIKKILEISRHAPSSHNTQPWKVAIDGDSVEIGFNPDRQLRVGDPNKRELFISLGCFIENFALVAEELDYKIIFEFIGKEPQLIARLKLEKVNITNKNKLSRLIVHRRSDRRYYTPKKIPVEVINALHSVSGKHTSLHIFTEKPIIDFLATATYNATYKTMSNPEFRSELASWVRNNWTKKLDGMPAFTQGIPGPVSLLAKLIIKKNKGVAKNQAKKDSQRILHSAAIGLVCAREQTPISWIEAGRLYQLVCLVALQSDVKSSGVSAAIIDIDTTKEIMKELSLKEKPVALLRFGYTKNNAKASPRLTVSHFVTERES